MTGAPGLQKTSNTRNQMHLMVSNQRKAQAVLGIKINLGCIFRFSTFWNNNNSNKDIFIPLLLNSLFCNTRHQNLNAISNTIWTQCDVSESHLTSFLNLKARRSLQTEFSSSNFTTTSVILLKINTHFKIFYFNSSPSLDGRFYLLDFLSQHTY